MYFLFIDTLTYKVRASGTEKNAIAGNNLVGDRNSSTATFTHGTVTVCFTRGSAYLLYTSNHLRIASDPPHPCAGISLLVIQRNDRSGK